LLAQGSAIECAALLVQCSAHVCAVLCVCVCVCVCLRAGGRAGNGTRGNGRV